MKRSLFTALFVTALGATSIAQTPPPPGTPMNPPPAGGPPPGPGGQMQGPGGQPAGPGGQMQGPGSPGGPGGQMQGPGPGGPGGQMHGPGHRGGAPWAPEKCEKQVPKLKKMAGNCVKIKKEDKRKGCFNQIETKLPPGFFEACRPQVEPVKAEIQAKEKELYPAQASGIGSGGQQGPGEGGPQGGPGMQPPTEARKDMKPVDCQKIGEKIRKEGESCLKKKDTPKRKVCFDKVGEHVKQSGAESACGDLINTIKTDFQTREAQTYPGQPSSIN